MTKWLLNNSRVYTDGKGKSYNCTNIVTAKDLHNTLTEYENKIHHLEKQINTTKNYTKIQQQLQQLENSIHEAKNDLNKIKELL
jgi:peptidoglycan hydrolase CwlO-like protein